ncbi:hypothetical protein N4P33_14510 [Streptomyces sp. 15-116A]|uniref:PH domain-containing protein n=1 Tax=Streptomyces sp. 15-116A TaxID=2259035 RepID=UPI0021B16ABE|nr:hypothetical protein [Streptomyces sp. 15-116A]MCT7353379.1 hypothetical protein [Streptomyces sp. 15-116A]
MDPRADRRVIHKYRLRLRQLVFITVFLGGPSVAAARPVFREDDVPMTFVAVMVMVLATVCLALIAFWRSATILYQDHIAVRQPFRTRRTRWSDVLSIEADDNPASSRMLLLDSEGRLFALLGGVQAHGHEARTIQDFWERSRGESWTPPSAAFVSRARVRAQARSSARVWGGLLAAGLFLALVATGIVLDA